MTLQLEDERTHFGKGKFDKSFVVGDRPWYSLGTQLHEAPSIEEGIKLAGLDWNVELKDLQTTDGVALDQKAVVRTDINKSLGVVSSGYKVLQNTEAFKFFEPFVENEMVTLDTAGSFFNGRRVFILAKINRENMMVTEDDQIEKYILLSNAHDGSQAVRVGYTPIRISCNNTLTIAHNSAKSNLIRVYHKGDLVQTISQLRETMNVIDQTFITTEETYKELAKLPVNVGDLQKYIKAVFSTQKLETLFDKEVQEEKAVRESIARRIEEVFAAEEKHNRWTMYNAVNYYLNHERGRDVESGYNSIWFQTAKRLDQKAFALAQRL